jgi:hypothetical protein
MADTNLEIGGLVSPDQLLNASETLAAQQRLMAREIFNQEPDVDDAFFADWSDFTVRFLAWKSASSSWFSRVWTSTRDELVGFLGEYARLRDRWAQMHEETNAGSLKVTANDTLSGAVDKAGTAVGAALRSIGIGLAVLVAVPLVGYLAWKTMRS